MKMFSPTYIDLYSKARCGKVESFHKMEEMSNEGDLLAKGYLAMILQRSTIITVPKDTLRAKLLLLELFPCFFQMEGEDVYDAANVWYILGFCFFEAIGVDRQDKEKAVHYYQLSASKGHALGQCALGNCYDVGDGVKQDLPRAVSYYKMSADQGFPVAQSNYCMCREHGEGCEVDQSVAVEYAELSAAQGYVDALYNLSLYYFQGKGVGVNIDKSIRLCTEGVLQGDLECMYTLAACYMEGYYHIPRDSKKGFELFLCAANRKHSFSQLHVAECYRAGVGVDKDVIECVRYLRRFLGGDKPSADYMEDMPGHYDRAEELLQECQEEYAAQVWSTRKHFLLFLAQYQFLYATAALPDHPSAGNYTHTCFYCKDICWTISSFI